jgi:hypothetical protein
MLGSACKKILIVTEVKVRSCVLFTLCYWTLNVIALSVVGLMSLFDTSDWTR